MANRLSKIVTRTGDSGSTGLANGERVAKTDPSIQALGEVDELNSLIGLALCEPMPQAVRDALQAIQHSLFDLGGELSLPGGALLDESHLGFLDKELEHWNANLPPLAEFVLPGGCRGAAQLHVARTVCRRAERSLANLAESLRSRLALPYLNRLSDLLFVLARVLNRSAGVEDILWKKRVV